MEGASANPIFSQWTKQLRLYAFALYQAFLGEGGEDHPPSFLPPSQSLVGMPRWNSLNVVNKNPTRKSPLGLEQEKNHPIGEA